MRPETHQDGPGDISEFDAQDGMFPESLRPIFIPPQRHESEDQAEPPAIIQALAALSLLALPLGMTVLGGAV
tara:strand:+ start:14894 stop:15109 length:216 start_codon:yes stop_codon:yes gene_type:complete